MYSFRERSDTTVVDEPLYAHYLTRTGVVHPAVDDVLAAQDSDGGAVVSDVILGPCPTPVLFVKNMAHHLEGLDPGFLDEVENVILTRDPIEMLPSLVHQVPNPSLEGTSLPTQVMLLERALAAGREPLVLDSRLLLLDPEGVLRRLCERLEIPWDPGMLSWPAGPKPEDGVWAPHWYEAVHRSTGFAPYRPKDDPVPDHLLDLLAECRPLYESLRSEALTGTVKEA